MSFTLTGHEILHLAQVLAEARRAPVLISFHDKSPDGGVAYTLRPNDQYLGVNPDFDITQQTEVYHLSIPYDSSAKHFTILTTRSFTLEPETMSRFASDVAGLTNRGIQLQDHRIQSASCHGQSVGRIPLSPRRIHDGRIQSNGV